MPRRWLEDYARCCGAWFERGVRTIPETSRRLAFEQQCDPATAMRVLEVVRFVHEVDWRANHDRDAFTPDILASLRRLAQRNGIRPAALSPKLLAGISRALPEYIAAHLDTDPRGGDVIYNRSNAALRETVDLLLSRNRAKRQTGDRYHWCWEEFATESELLNSALSRIRTAYYAEAIDNPTMSGALRLTAVRALDPIVRLMYTGTKRYLGVAAEAAVAQTMLLLDIGRLREAYERACRASELFASLDPSQPMLWNPSETFGELHRVAELRAYNAALKLGDLAVAGRHLAQARALVARCPAERQFRLHLATQRDDADWQRRLGEPAHATLLLDSTLEIFRRDEANDDRRLRFLTLLTRAKSVCAEKAQRSAAHTLEELLLIEESARPGSGHRIELLRAVARICTMVGERDAALAALSAALGVARKGMFQQSVTTLEAEIEGMTESAPE